MSLPNSKDPRGYTMREIKSICKERKIKSKDFNNAFGVNTCRVGEDGTVYIYKYDIERALYQLKNKYGTVYIYKYDEWD